MSSLISKFPLSLSAPILSDYLLKKPIVLLSFFTLHFASPCYSLRSSLVLYITYKLESRGLIKFRFFCFVLHDHFIYVNVFFHQEAHSACIALFCVVSSHGISFLFLSFWPSPYIYFIDYSHFKNILFPSVISLSLFVSYLWPFLHLFVVFFYNVDFKCCNSQGRDPLLLHCALLLDFIHCPTFEYCMYEHSFPISPDTSSLNFSLTLDPYIQLPAWYLYFGVL